MKKDFTAIFCFVDDFIKNYDQNLVAVNSRKKKTGPRSSLNLSEVVTILIGFYQSSLDCFKHYYQEIILPYNFDDFSLVSYEHFTRLIGFALPLLTLILDSLFKQCDGISFVDSTSIAVCKNYRIYSHKVFQGFAARSKTTKGWFYGLKLHLVINLEGSIVKASFSSGNKDDRKHFCSMTEGIFGKVFGDRGYISKKVFNDLWDEDIQLITRVNQGMKNMLLSITDKLLLLKRVLIETVIGRIKLLDKFEHTRHRSLINALSHMVASLINYQLLPDKPSIKTFVQLDHSFPPNSQFALYKAVSTITANLIGAQNYKHINKLLFSAIKLIICLSGLLFIPLVLKPDFFIQLFIKGEDVKSLDILIKATLFWGWVYFIFDNILWVFGGILIAAKDTMFIGLTNTILVWICAIIPSISCLILQKGSPDLVWRFYVLYAIITSLLFYLRYKNKSWGFTQNSSW